MMLERFPEQRVLLVEDDPFQRLFVKAALSADRVIVDEASTERDALAAIETTQYDLILLDVFLDEGPSGRRVLQRIRSDERLCGTPVIMLSACAKEDECMVDSLEAGAQDYLVKPVSAGLLRARVRSACRTRLMHRALEARMANSESKVQAYAGEFDAAARLQRKVSSSYLRSTASVDVRGLSIPHAGVGGDFFTSLVDPQGHMVVALVDVSGHGLRAALMASALREALRRSVNDGRGARAIHHDLIRCLGNNGFGFDAIASVGILRFAPDGTRVELVNAGLPPMVLVSPGDRLGPWPCFESSAPPAGLVDLLPSCDVIDVSPGDMFFMVSDGATRGDTECESVLRLARQFCFSEDDVALRGATDSDLERRLRAAYSGEPLDDDATVVLAARSGSL